MPYNDYAGKALDEFSIPHIVFPQETMEQKKVLAWHVASLSGEDVLLASSFAFSYEGIIAGLNIVQIEYFAKNAPANYKKELLNAISQLYKIQEVIEIAKEMDEDVRMGKTENQNRVKNVIRYIRDNKEAFQF